MEVKEVLQESQDEWIENPGGRPQGRGFSSANAMRLFQPMVRMVSITQHDNAGLDLFRFAGPLPDSSVHCELTGHRAGRIFALIC